MSCLKNLKNFTMKEFKIGDLIFSYKFPKSSFRVSKIVLPFKTKFYTLTDIETNKDKLVMESDMNEYLVVYSEAFKNKTEFEEFYDKNI